MTEKEKKEWEAFKREWSDVLRMFGSLLFSPLFVLVGIGYGIRAGVIEAFGVTLRIFKEWE